MPPKRCLFSTMGSRSFARKFEKGLRGTFLYSCNGPGNRNLPNFVASHLLDVDSPMVTHFRSFSTNNDRQHKKISKDTDQQDHTDNSSSCYSNDSTDEDKSHGSGSRGKIFIGLGWTLLGLLLVDQVLQYQQKQERDRLLRDLQEEANARNPMPPAWSESDNYNDENDKSTHHVMDAKYQCKVLRIESSLDGTHVLRGIAVGDVVDVLEENVGPNSHYHLCRRHRGGHQHNDGSIGWYPIQFLQKV